MVLKGYVKLCYIITKEIMIVTFFPLNRNFVKVLFGRGLTSNAEPPGGTNIRLRHDYS
jgi:hypothetical protein